MATKYLLLVGDGMADRPQEKLDGKTPLAYAQTPGMDAIAARGKTGTVSTIPPGLLPGSDVANLSLMGYDPTLYYEGRAPLEAASMGITLKRGQVAFRCNLVFLDNGHMVDYSAGHIETNDAREIISELKASLDSDMVTLYPGVSYRHLIVISGVNCKGLQCTPPHDITLKEYEAYLPHGPGESCVRNIMHKACDVLKKSAVNARRLQQKKCPVSDVWLWGQGQSIVLPTLFERYGITGSVISAVDLVRGIGKLAGLTVKFVKGATGYLDTNYAGKVTAACEALRDQSFVYVHVEAPDETSHEGSLDKKIKAIEDFDRHVVSELVRFADQAGGIRVMVVPDHATPLALRTHDSSPVPFAVYGPGIASGQVKCYAENTVVQTPVFSGPSLFEAFIHGTF